jgi:hypothetical protein
VYSGNIVSGGSIIQTQPLIPDQQAITSSLGFFAYAYFLIAPLTLYGYRLVRSPYLAAWSTLCFAGLLFELFPLIGLNILRDQWSLLIDIPLCIYAVAGIARLSAGHREILKRLTIPHIRILRVFLFLLFILSSIYIVVPAQQAPSFFTIFPNSIPSSLVQNTVPASDMESLGNLLTWTSRVMTPQTALITHAAINGWARAYFPSGKTIIDYGFSSPWLGVDQAQKMGFSSVFLIWWIPRLGWYGQTTIPSTFALIHVDGNVGVYTYSINQSA